MSVGGLRFKAAGRWSSSRNFQETAAGAGVLVRQIAPLISLIYSVADSVVAAVHPGVQEPAAAAAAGRLLLQTLTSDRRRSGRPGFVNYCPSQHCLFSISTLIKKFLKKWN